MGQVRIPAVLMRGGTSKGVFIRRELMPERREDRDALVLALLGTPDPMQIDGLGGTHSSTSKVMAVGPSRRPDCDVDYLFAQGAVTEPVVGYSANCGNLTAAVGAFAVDEGMVAVSGPVTVVRMFNENTGKVVHAHVPISDGRAATEGDCEIAGVPGTGAAILTEYLDPGGSEFGSLLPTGNPRDRIDVEGVGAIEVSIVDATIPIVFVRPGDLGVAGDELPEQLNADAGLLRRLEKIRGTVAVNLGAAKTVDGAAVESMATPKIGWIAPPRDTRTVGGKPLRGAEMDVLGRMVSVGKMHHALPLTGLMCAAVACAVPGTLPHEAGNVHGSGWVRVGLSKGVVAAHVEMERDGKTVRSVSVERTARRLMAGEVYLRGEAGRIVRDMTAA